MAQNPPTGVVCSAGVVEACCCLVSPIQLPVTSIGTLKVALKSRTVDLSESISVREVDRPLQLHAEICNITGHRPFRKAFPLGKSPESLTTWEKSEVTALRVRRHCVMAAVV